MLAWLQPSMNSKKNAESKAAIYEKGFFLALAILFLVLAGPFLLDWSNFFGFSSLQDWFLWLLPKSTIIMPALWLVLFFSKRRSEQNRLREEYAHKEALAKSYDSYKKQIDKLGEEKGKVLSHLLTGTITALLFNPSSTLDKKHGDKMPLEEAGSNLLEK